jgi:hypothetical protein
MRRLPTVSRRVRVVLLLAAFVGLAAMSVPSCNARSIASRSQLGHVRLSGVHRSGNSLVRCSSLRQPSHLGRSWSRRQDLARARAGYFAPTNQAMFFSHAGDRCLWRSRTAARG